MKLRSGRVIFSKEIEGNKFLNTYSSISYINNSKILKYEIKKLITKWYLWLIRKHIESEYIITPWYLFSVSMYNKWNEIKTNQ